jgi:hypothetical protein
MVLINSCSNIIAPMRVANTENQKRPPIAKKITRSEERSYGFVELTAAGKCGKLQYEIKAAIKINIRTASIYRFTFTELPSIPVLSFRYFHESALFHYFIFEGIFCLILRIILTFGEEMSL